MTDQLRYRQVHLDFHTGRKNTDLHFRRIGRSGVARAFRMARQNQGRQ
jgi:hypothetical protein